LTGGVALVVAVGKTTKPQLAAAIGHIETVGGRVLGFIMNKIPTKGVDAYRYRYSYKYGSYGSYGNYGAYGKYGNYGAYGGAYGTYTQAYGEEAEAIAKVEAKPEAKNPRKSTKKA
jgi:Mrp family chromosome partitioning ATPase